jgi:hypothetical protein
MLQYIQGHSRPDITSSVAQCSPYTHHPRHLHEIAFQQIVGIYLKGGTKNHGLIFNLDKSNEAVNIDCYVDANFAGMWGHGWRWSRSKLCTKTSHIICHLHQRIPCGLEVQAADWHCHMNYYGEWIQHPQHEHARCIIATEIVCSVLFIEGPRRRNRWLCSTWDLSTTHDAVLLVQ